MSLEKRIAGTAELHGRKRRLVAPSAIAIALGLAVVAGVPHPVLAADDQQLQMLEDQIRQLQAQIDALRKDQMKQAQAQAPVAIPAGTKPAAGYETGGHQFGWVSADGKNSIEITGRLHLDTAGYFGQHFSPGLINATGATNPAKLESGFDARRARFGVTGKFADDFLYTFILDFGGSSDSISPFVSGAATSEIENAFITYNGFNKPDQTVPMAFDVGYLDLPIQLNEAMSSNDRLMMEAPTPEVVATQFGGGDARSALGVRSYKSSYYAAAYVTGPAAGTPHNFATAGSTTATTQQVTAGEALAFLGRATYQPWSDSAGNNLHVGVSGSYMENPGFTTSTAAGGTPAFTRSLTLGDRFELRVDPTSVFSTTITNVSHGGYVGGELAGQYDHFFAQSEFYEYLVDREGQVAPVLSSLSFWGAYAEASWTIGGRRNYNPTIGAYSGVAVDHPLDMKGGSGWGAVEFAGRFSYTDLNDGNNLNTATVTGVEGGTLSTASIGVNYYPYNNVKFMVDYIHSELSRATTGASPVGNGGRIDAVAARFQVAW